MDCCAEIFSLDQMENAQYYVAAQDDTYKGIAAKCNCSVKALLAYNCLSGEEGILGFERILIPCGNWKKHRHIVRCLRKLFCKKHCKKPLIKIVEYCEDDITVILVAIIGIKKHKLIPRELLTSLSLPGFSNCELYPLIALEEYFASSLNCSCIGQLFSGLKPPCECLGCNSLVPLIQPGPSANQGPIPLAQNCNCNCNGLIPLMQGSGATGSPGWVMNGNCNQNYGPTWNQVNCCGPVRCQNGLLGRILQGA